MTELNWKKHLLASGAPLEFEVARVLAEADFYVTADYEYLRQEGGFEKQFSVDLSATLMKESRTTISYTIELLAECKHRSREKTLFFFEDPNSESFHAIAGYTVPYIDELSPFHLDANPIYAFENSFPFVYKGIELFEKGANEKDFKHAVQQLRYAAPDFLRSTLVSILGEHEEDRHPRFLTRVLVTNAPLRLITAQNVIHSIEQADNLEDISREVPAVILMSGVGPEFTSHYKRVMSSIRLEEWDGQLRSIEYQLHRDGKKSRYYKDKPADFVRHLADMDYTSNRFIQQTFVVNFAFLSDFLSVLKDTCLQAYRGRKKSDSPRRRTQAG